MKASRRYKARRLHKSATSFICVVNGNDVLAMLERMLTYGQMTLCTAQIKKAKPTGLDFFGSNP